MDNLLILSRLGATNGSDEKKVDFGHASDMASLATKINELSL